MGCAQSAYQDMPVTGSDDRMVLVPGGERFVSDQQVTLKLKEKLWSFSGDDFTIKDVNDVEWFKIEGTVMSMSGKAKLLDIQGQEVCNYRKKMLSLHATAYISAPEKTEGQTMVLATIKRRGMMSFDASAEIFIHQPPVSLDSVSTEGMVPAITVEGDMIGKNFDFMKGTNRDNPVKIGQVNRKFKMLSERNSYYITIGTNVDIAFIMMAAYAIDELFNDNK